MKTPNPFSKSPSTGLALITCVSIVSASFGANLPEQKKTAPPAAKAEKPAAKPEPGPVAKKPAVAPKKPAVAKADAVPTAKSAPATPAPKPAAKKPAPAKPAKVAATASVKAPAKAAPKKGTPAKPALPVRPSGEIDRILAASWKEAGVQPNPIASDEVFLRRVYLDVIGRIPSVEEAERFLSSKAPDRRARLIDELLASEGYVNHFYNYWADILRINSALPAGQNIMPFYIEWVRDSLRENLPYDRFARELITAKGQAWENGAVGYYVRDRGMPLDHMANTVRIFLGTRLECAQCHDHPFDDWTQMDFFKMAAFSYGVNPGGSDYGALTKARSLVTKNADMPEDRKSDLSAALTEVSRVVRNNYMVTHRTTLPKLPHDYAYDDAKPNQVIQPATMFGADPKVGKGDDRVAIYADWLTSPENPMFTTVIANRLWTKLMGEGLYDSVDEYTEYSKPSHPELMAFLEEQMKAREYDMKSFLRLVLNSKVYQREAIPRDLAADEASTFAGPMLRRMTAEQVWDSLVSLVNPTPELGNWKRDQLFQLRMAEQESMLEVLQDLEPGDMLEAAKEIAGMQKEIEKEEKDLRARIAEAQKAKDGKLVAELNREVNGLRTELRSKLVERVFHPGMKAEGVASMEMMLPTGKEVEVSPMMMDGNGSSSATLRKMQTEAETAMIKEEMKSLGMQDPAARKQYDAFRRDSFRTMLRAAYLSSPAPPGHFLREFGQSDRDTIENANADASVPQALALLNGTTFTKVVHPQSVLTRETGGAKTPEEKLDRLYLAILTRKPTGEEKARILSHREARGKALYQDVAFALLNGQEFWFVQ